MPVEKIVLIVFIASLLLGFLFFLLTWYVYHGLWFQNGVIRRGSRNRKAVALTFDDGPTSEYTTRILDVLKDKNVKATFFLVGREVEKNPDIARRIVIEGHEIGNHTYRHFSLIPRTKRGIRLEIDKADKVITRVTGVKPEFFRPPRGLYDSNVLRIVENYGYTMVLWTVSSEDWMPPRAQKMEKRLLKKIKEGSIILFHDGGAILGKVGKNRNETVESLPTIIDNFREMGYTFVVISELLDDM